MPTAVGNFSLWMACMKQEVLKYIQYTLHGIGIASMGTLNILEPQPSTLIYGSVCILGGFVIVIMNKEE